MLKKFKRALEKILDFDLNYITFSMGKILFEYK